ncbi:MAG: hypothetical protein Q8934_08945 [Bacillota bacterium]|nr:hypothetical protein [Bacillota bacterium]
MNQFIVASAFFLIFSWILLQWVANERTHMTRATFTEIVETHAQEAREAGYFTPEIIDAMKQDIENDMDIPESEIQITATDTPKYRQTSFNDDNLISYTVEIPIKRVIAMSSFFGNQDKDHYWFPISGKVASELQAPR